MSLNCLFSTLLWSIMPLSGGREAWQWNVGVERLLCDCGEGSIWGPKHLHVTSLCGSFPKHPQSLCSSWQHKDIAPSSLRQPFAPAEAYRDCFCPWQALCCGWHCVTSSSFFTDLSQPGETLQWNDLCEWLCPLWPTPRQCAGKEVPRLWQGLHYPPGPWALPGM